MWRDDRKIRSEELRSIFTRDSTRKDEFNLCNNEFSNINVTRICFLRRCYLSKDITIDLTSCAKRSLARETLILFR